MEQQTILGNTVSQPLAARLRPQTLEEFVGQTHLLGEGKVLRRLIESDQISSMIFWGPPGVGKTTLARIIANRTRAEFIDFSAVTSGIKEIREVMRQAEENRRFGARTIVFVDEIHRFNKAQQDAFLPFVEKGSIVLIGATTENPSFEVNSALLSRCKVFVLQPLSVEELTALLTRAVTDARGFGQQKIRMAEDVLPLIANFANGDARTALSTLEMVVLNGETEGDTVTVSREILEQCISKKSLLFTNPCAILTRTRRSIGWPGCWRRGRIPSMWPGGSPGLPARMWGWQIPGPWRSPWPPIRPATLSVCPSAPSI